MSQYPRVAVVCGGPAGAAAAVDLARRCVPVVLVESVRGPAAKVGECLPSWCPWSSSFSSSAPTSCGACARRLPRPSPTGACDAVSRYGAATSQAAGPLAVRAEAVARFPAAAEASGRVIDFYLRESLGGEELEEGERAALERALGETEKLIRPLKKAS